MGGKRVQGALLGAADIRFTKLPGDGRYEGLIYVGGRHYGYVFQRAEDEQYVAKTAANEHVGEAGSLRDLRLVVEKHALGV